MDFRFVSSPIAGASSLNYMWRGEREGKRERRREGRETERDLYIHINTHTHTLNFSICFQRAQPATVAAKRYIDSETDSVSLENTDWRSVWGTEKRPRYWSPGKGGGMEWWESGLWGGQRGSKWPGDLRPCRCHKTRIHRREEKQQVKWGKKSNFYRSKNEIRFLAYQANTPKTDNPLCCCGCMKTELSSMSVGRVKEGNWWHLTKLACIYHWIQHSQFKAFTLKTCLHRYEKNTEGYSLQHFLKEQNIGSHLNACA